MNPGLVPSAAYGKPLTRKASSGVSVVVSTSENLKLINDSSKEILKEFITSFEKISKINKENLEKIINELIDRHKTNFKGIGQPLRIALTGSKFGPGVYDIILSLEKDEVIKRLKVIK